MSIRSVVAATRRGLLGIALCAARAADAADFTPLGSLPDPNNFGSAAHAVAADGRTIAGESVVFRFNVNQPDAVLWRNDLGPTSLGIPAAFGSAATALSADGKAAIGYSQGNGVPGTFAFYWSELTGPVAPSPLPGYGNTSASAISADGSTMVGSIYNVGPPWTPEVNRQAVRWSRNENFLLALGFLSGGSNPNSWASAVSADGAVVVGASTSGSSEEGFRWTSATGMVGLGFLPGGTSSAASLVSGDGQVIVGSVGFAWDPSRHAAFRWTEAGGMIDLGVLPGAVITLAQAMSPDGLFVVGQSGTEAFRWSETGGITGLGHLPGDQGSSAIAVSDDGAVILGRSLFADGHTEYFVWTLADGLRSLSDLLAASGVDISGWGNLQAEALSGNGNTIVGRGINPSGFNEGWAIRLQGNRAPIASIGYSPQFPPKRTPISFWGTGSTDPDGDEIVNLRWDFGDGTTAVGPVVSHTYPDARNYTVTLVVGDGKVDSAPVSMVVAIFDRTPVANAGGPYSGAKNAAIRFDGTASTDGDGDPLTYAWNFGDGTTGTGPTPTHAYARSGVYTVSLVVNDGSADSTPPARAQVTVTNTAPVALLSGPASGFKLTTLTWNGSGSSDANGDTLSYRWDFGDGSSAITSTPTTTHSYAAVGSYQVTLTVTDGEASSTPATANVAIQSKPPVANAGPDQTVTQRTAVALNGATSNDPDGTIAGVRWVQVAGPAVTLSGSTTLSPTFEAPRVQQTSITLTFELTVTDNDGVSSSDRVNVNVTRK
jgi:probable HAF family extracellular repeat protein